MNNVILSPDNNHRLELVTMGSIRFGPEYYQAKINAMKFEKMIVGYDHLWSSDSQFLALQEWMTTDEREGPVTRVTIFDLVNERYMHDKILQKGLAENFKFEKNIFLYKGKFFGQDLEQGMSVILSEEQEWIDCNGINSKQAQWWKSIGSPVKKD